MLRFGVDRTFNCISVDGHMSTSDTVLLMANGASDVAPDNDDSDEAKSPGRPSSMVMSEKLATDIIRDAEGADHFHHRGSRTGSKLATAAFAVAKEIAESALVKTAITGNDPNWGRITSAAGYAGIKFDAAQLISGHQRRRKFFRSGTPVEYVR